MSPGALARISAAGATNGTSPMEMDQEPQPAARGGPSRDGLAALAITLVAVVLIVLAVIAII
jgi:hypothetical protein